MAVLRHKSCSPLKIGGIVLRGISGSLVAILKKIDKTVCFFMNFKLKIGLPWIDPDFIK